MAWEGWKEEIGEGIDSIQDTVQSWEDKLEENGLGEDLKEAVSGIQDSLENLRNKILES